MAQESNVPWSPQLRDQTLKQLREPSLLPDGLLHMKHKTEGYGHFRIEDLVAGRLTLYRKGESTSTPFSSPEEVDASGWAID